MTIKADAAGAVHAPTVVVENTVAALEAALADAKAADEALEPSRQLAAATAKVEKLRAHLAAAEANLAQVRSQYEGK